MKYHIINIIILSISVSACFSGELSDEYKKARIEAYNEIHKSYNECRTSTHAYLYWKKVSECKRTSSKRNETCFEVIDHSIVYSEQDTAHCETFKPTRDDIKNYLSKIVSEKGIKKWKDNKK